MWSQWRKSTRSNGAGACIEVSVWRKSTRSNGSGNCVEVSVSSSAVRVRDSKDAPGPRLTFTGAAMTAFLAEVKHPRDDI